ncbi:hypothetical protein GCM10020000_54580 [Streptomyces olivoverticillatus]
MQDMEFSVSNAGMQLLRGRTGSVGLGGNGQFTRLASLDRIAAAERRPWQRGALLEDYELGLHMILSGDRISHIADTWVSQEGLPHGRRFLTQRTRWAQGNLQCVRYAPRIVSSRHYGGKGVLETLYTFLQPVAHLVTLALCAVMFVFLGLTAARDGFGAAFGGMLALWPLVLALAVVSVLPFVLWGPVYRRDRAPDRSLLTALLWGARPVAVRLPSLPGIRARLRTDAARPQRLGQDAAQRRAGGLRSGGHRGLTPRMSVQQTTPVDDLPHRSGPQGNLHSRSAI